MNVAIQSYNYGGGYVGYVAGKGKKHTFNLAESFAREKSGGKKVTYTNPIAVAKNGGWRYGYGNMFYVELVKGGVGIATAIHILPALIFQRFIHNRLCRRIIKMCHGQILIE